jgi:hypothetical protein
LETQVEKDQAKKFEQLLDRSGIDADDVAHVDRMNVWQGFIKNNEGEIETTDLLAMQFTPKKSDDDLESHFINRAHPTRITPSRRKTPTRDSELTLVLGDAQIGFRGEEAFHDETAMSLAQLAIRELMPDRVVFVGDMLDLPGMSRFEQRGDWQSSTQASIDRYHDFLAETRANIPNGEIIAISGNHELRMDKYLRKDASELLGIRRANAEHELAVLTLRYLVRMDDLQVQNIDGYPNAAYWINDQLKATHGTNVAKGGSNAAKYLQEADSGTIYGHTHRVETAYRTYPTRDGHNTIVAASPGALARITGHVPGFNYSVDDQNRTVPKAENWQQGLLLVEHTDSAQDVTPVMFNGNKMRLNGKQYEV